MKVAVERWGRIIKRYVLPAAAALVALLIIYKLTDDSGEVIWEFRPQSKKDLSEIAVWKSAVIVGCGDGKVYALDAGTGAVCWEFSAGNGLAGSRPTVVGKLCLVWDDTAVYALDVHKGEPVWKAGLGEGLEDGFEPGPGGGPAEEPVREAGKGPAEDPAKDAAKDAGKEPVNEPVKIIASAVSGNVVAEDGVVCFVCDHYREPTSQERRATRIDTLGGTFRRPKLTKVMAGSSFRALDLTNGEELWRRDAEPAFLSREFAARGGTVYFSRTSYTEEGPVHELVATDLKTGEDRWKAVISGGLSTGIHPTKKGVLIESKENVYFVSTKGRELWRKRKDKRQPPPDAGAVSSAEWAAAFEETFEDWSPTVAGDSVLVTRVGRIECLDLATGQKRWDAEVAVADSGPFDRTTAPVAGGGLVFVSSFTVKTFEAAEEKKGSGPSIPTYRAPDVADVVKQFSEFPNARVRYIPSLHALDLRTGERRWTLEEIGGRTKYSNGHLFTMDDTGRYHLMDNAMVARSRITMLDPRDGEVLWKHSFAGTVKNAVADEEMLYFGSFSMTQRMGSSSRARPQDHAVQAISIGR
jgi:outer membrane protein assembly factor BamB